MGKQREKLVNEASKYPTLAPRGVLIPYREDGPVPGLAVHDGWECTRCPYVCRSDDNMEKEHARKQHGWMSSMHKIWQQQTVQVNSPFVVRLCTADKRLSSPPHCSLSISQLTEICPNLQLFPGTTLSRNS